MTDLSGFSMMELFRQEAETQVALLNDGLLALEQGAGSDADLESLMRAAHSIKGAARIVGLDRAVELAHALEDCFVAAQQGKLVIDAPAADRLLQAVDLLAQMADSPEIPAADLEALVLELRSLGSAPALSSAGPQPSPDPAPPEDLPDGPPVKAEQQESDPADMDRSLRISAAGLSRLLELSGEALVQSAWQVPFIERLRRLKTSQSEMLRQLEMVRRCVAQDQTAPLDGLIRDLQQAMNAARRRTDQALEEFEFAMHRTGELLESLHRQAVAGRMRPLSDGTQGLPRMVRDLARRLGKQVRLEINGSTVPVDREVLAMLEAPLTHMLRNALDHGLEAPEERIAAGKPAVGLLRIAARHHAGMLHVTVSDDGRGIDPEGVRRRAAERGLAAPEALQRMTEDEVLDFLFLPGFSTTDRVSELSGRGVGMDIVRQLAQQLGGVAEISSRKGAGVTVRLQVPVSLTLLRVLLVEIAGEPYALPLARVHRLARASEDVRLLEGRRFLALDGSNIGLIDAAELLGFAAAPTAEAVVVLGAGNEFHGLLTDRLLGESKLVVRRLDARLGKLRNISAAAMMDDGTPVLILDVDDLLCSINRLLSGGGLKAQPVPESVTTRRSILVADDSITVREIERRLLEGQGYQVDVAVDGMDAWNNLRERSYDLVVTDIDMPRLNGIDLVRRIRADGRLRELPVVVVSYKDQTQERQSGLEAGANFYLSKSSFQDDTFVRAVAGLLGEG
ncbi:MAG: response regulator [Kiritimatiellia bacterium]